MMWQNKIRNHTAAIFSASLKRDKMVASVLDHELEIIRAQPKDFS